MSGVECPTPYGKWPTLPSRRIRVAPPLQVIKLGRNRIVFIRPDIILLRRNVASAWCTDSDSVVTERANLLTAVSNDCCTVVVSWIYDSVDYVSCAAFKWYGDIQGVYKKVTSPCDFCWYFSSAEVFCVKFCTTVKQYNVHILSSRFVEINLTSSSAIAEKPRCSVRQFWVAITPYSADRSISIKSNQIEIIDWLWDMCIAQVPIDWLSKV